MSAGGRERSSSRARAMTYQPMNDSRRKTLAGGFGEEDAAEDEEEERRADEILDVVDKHPTIPPEDDVVDRIYSELLTSRGVPEAMLENLEQQPRKKKWDLIVMEAQSLRDKSSKDARTWDSKKSDILNRIDSAYLPDLEVIQNELLPLLRGTGRNLLRKFIRDDGLAVVLRAVQRRLVSYPRSALDTIICRDYLLCLKAIGKTEDGMDMLLDHPEATDTITLCLDFEWSSNACLVLEILGVITDYSVEGRERCYKSLLRLSRRRLEPPFYLLCQEMKRVSEGSVRVKASIATLVNVIIEFTEELEVRNQIRNELLAFGFIQSIHSALRDEKSLRTDPGAQEVSNSLLSGSHNQSISTPYLSSQEYAEDGETEIDAAKGHMCGVCVAVKDRDGTQQKIAGLFSKSTKHRWYEIKDEELSWYHTTEKPKPGVERAGSIDAGTFVSVNVTSDNQELLKSTSFGFEIVTKDRIYVLGTTTEEQRIKWTTALHMAFNAAAVKKHKDDIQKTIKLTDDEFDDNLRRLENEVERFEKLWQHDRSQSMIDFTVDDGPRSIIDASSLESCINKLVSHAKENGFEGTLSNIVKELLTLPMDPDFGSMAWKAVHTSVQDIQQMEHRHHPYEYGKLEQLIIKRKDMEEQFKNVAGLNSAIRERDTKVQDLEVQVETLRSSGGGGVQSLSAAPPVPPRPPPSSGQSDVPGPSGDPRLAKYHKMLKMHIPRPAVEMKMRTDGLDPALLDTDATQGDVGAGDAALSQAPPSDPRLAKYHKMLKMHIPRPAVEMKMRTDGLDPALLDTDAAQGGVGAGSTGVEAGPPVSEDPKYKKFFKMLKMHIPKGAVAQKMAAEGLDSSVLDLDPSSSLPSCGSGGALSAFVMPAALPKPAVKQPVKPQDDVLLKELNMEPKPEVVPGTKLKQVYWTKVPLTTIKGSVWQTLGPDLSIGTGYRESLDAAFATKSAPASVGVPSKDLGGCKEKKEVNIIEPKRGQNVAIGLGRYRLTDEQFHTAFVALDPSILTAETVPKFLLLLPTAEEFATVNDYAGEVSLLGRTERFFRSVGRINRLIERVSALDISLTFDEEANELEVQLGGIKTALDALHGASSLQEALRIVLSVGNYLNGGTVRGLAHGFDLNFLAKLTTIKASAATGRKKSLVHFVAAIAETNTPGIVDTMSKELASLHANTSVTLTQMTGDVRKLQSRVDKVKREMETGSGGPQSPPELSGPFNDRIAPFVSAAVGRMDSLQAKIQDAETLTKAIVTMFAIKNSGGDVAQWIIQTVSQFILDMKQAKVDNDIEEEEVKKAKEKAPTASGASKSGSGRPSGKEKESEDLFKKFAASRGGDVIAELEEKMNKRRSTGRNQNLRPLG